MTVFRDKDPWLIVYLHHHCHGTCVGAFWVENEAEKNKITAAKIAELEELDFEDTDDEWIDFETYWRYDIPTRKPK